MHDYFTYTEKNYAVLALTLNCNTTVQKQILNFSLVQGCKIFKQMLHLLGLLLQLQIIYDVGGNDHFH